MICDECANPCEWDDIAHYDPDPPGYAICKECVMTTEWRLLCGEWVLTGFRPSIYPGGGFVRRPMFTLSPFGPPFRYRTWHRENKNWERWTLEHCRNIEEAKACLQVSLRML